MVTIIAIPKLLVGFSLTIFAASFAFPSLAFSPILLSRHKIQATSRLFLSVSGSEEEEEEVNNTGHDGSSLLHTVTTSSSMHRRNLLLGLLATTVATASSLPVASPALATGDEKLVPVYFGVGKMIICSLIHSFAARVSIIVVITKCKLCRLTTLASSSTSHTPHAQQKC